MKCQDPTRQEMIEYLGETMGVVPPAFEIEEAIYWFANDCYNGQGSNLYEALCASPYKPGRATHGPEQGEGEVIYRELLSKFTDIDKCITESKNAMAARALIALKAYAAIVNPSEQFDITETITDLVTDLMHLNDLAEPSTDFPIALAESNYDASTSLEVLESTEGQMMPEGGQSLLEYFGLIDNGATDE